MKWRIVVDPLVRALVPALVGAILALLADAGLLDHQGRVVAQEALAKLSELSLSSPVEAHSVAQ